VHTIQINILGTFGIASDLELKEPSSAHAVALLVLFGASTQYERRELIDKLWPNHPNADEQDDSHESLDTALKLARRSLGIARDRLRSRTPRVYLKHGRDKHTNTDLGSDYLRFMQLSGSTRPHELREAVLLTRGRIGAGLVTTGMAEDWLTRLDRKHRVAIADILRKLFPKARDIEQMVEDVLDFGGLTVLGRKSGAAFPISVPVAFDELGWRTLGVTPAAIGPPLPEPLARPHLDEPLDRALKSASDAQAARRADTSRERFVLLSGPSLAGKTRGLYEAAMRHSEFRELATLAPNPLDHADVARALATAADAREPLLLWLDDIDGCCGYESSDRGITPGKLHDALVSNPELVVLATSGGKGPQRIDPREQVHRFAQVWRDLIDLAGHRVNAWTAGNVASDVPAARRAGWPEPIVADIAEYGLGSALGAGPKLVETLDAARTMRPPYGWALVSAVGLLQQEGWFSGPVPERVAKAAWLALADNQPAGLALQETWDAALAFAKTKVAGEARLVYAADAGLTTHDYVRARLKMTGVERRRTLQAAVEAMTAEECATAPWDRAPGDDLMTLRLAVRVAYANPDAAAPVLYEAVDNLDAWPSESATIDPATRLVELVGERDIRLLAVPRTLRFLAGLSMSQCDDFIQRLSHMSDGDLLHAAIEMVRQGRSRDDYSLVHIANGAPFAREQLALTFHFVVSGLGSPDDGAGRRDPSDILARELIVSSDATEVKGLQQLFTAYVDEYGIHPLASLFTTVIDHHRVHNKPEAASRALAELDRLGRAEDWGEPSLAYSRATLELWVDPQNKQATATLYGLIHEGDAAPNAAEELFCFYRRQGSASEALRVLEAVADPTARASLLWHELVSSPQISWLEARARIGDIQAAIVLHRVADDDLRREASTLVEKAAEHASPLEIQGAYSLASDDRDGYGFPDDTKATDAQLACLLVDKLREYVATLSYVPIALGEMPATDIHGLISDAMIATEAGYSDGFETVENWLAHEYPSEMLQPVRDQWASLVSDALTPVWRWAMTLPCANETPQNSGRDDRLTLF
jgi:hypothetical protein